jgi:pantoate--beta-alanine ligase
MNIVRDLPSLRQVIADWKKQGKCIAFVPTMGNLHDGHLSLLQRGSELSDKTVVSIFVNPIQFGRGEDYETYPSTLDGDMNKLQSLNLDLLFTPDLTELYPGGVDADTRVNVPVLSSILCGRSRPTHFSGVATVVTKLLINIMPDYALFGEKDYQQLLIIRRLASDLCIPTEIIGMPVIREKDGLAMSSRNAYLSDEERKLAPLIYQILTKAAQEVQNQKTKYEVVEREAMETLENAGFKPEYFSIRRSIDLDDPGPGDRELSILVAAWLGSARLIDNVKVILDD